MAVRQFSLINEKGQEFSLMDYDNYCFLSSPSGLGIEFNIEYEQMGNSFIESMKKVKQGKIPGNVYFKNYDNYLIPYDSGEKIFYRDVNILSLSKSEKDNKLGVLVSQIQFDCLTVWYEVKSIDYSYDESSNALIWDFPWDSYFVDYGNRNIEFINDGQIDSIIELEVDGEFENINLQLYVENELYQEIPITVRIEQYEKLFYSSKENEFEISKILTDGTKQSLFTLDNIDFSKDNVMRIPPNKSCKIVLDSTVDIESAKLKIYIYHLVV